MKLKVTQFAALLLLLLVTGLFWGTWFAISRSIQDFSAAEFIHIGKVIIANVAVPMRIILPACILLMFLSVWFYAQKRSTGFYLSIFSFILIVIVLYITVGIEVPMDNQIKLWTASTVPPDWEAIRSKWEFFHTMRTFVSLVSFGSFAASMLFFKSSSHARLQFGQESH